MRYNSARPTWNKLSAQQQYLLQRLPGKYDLSDGKTPPEPKEVKRARLLVHRWDYRESTRKCKTKKRNETLLERARQAIYFDPPEKALRIVQQVEKLVKGCPV